MKGLLQSNKWKVTKGENMMRIAFFDSGIGGLTVLQEAWRQMPKERFLYYADKRHVPYGTKSVEEVKACIDQAVHEIMQYDVKALVIACNTATSIAVTDLRKSWPIPIIGMEPAVKPAVELSLKTGKRVLVFATPLTLQQSKYTELVSRVDDHSIVDSLPLPELVRYCESLQFDPAVMDHYFLTKLKPFDLDDYGTVVLGCTHYPFYAKQLRRLLPLHIRIIDGSVGTVNRLQQQLQEQQLAADNGSGEIEFVCSAKDGIYIEKMQQAWSYLHL